MFRIKICGVTTSADARLACVAGADAIGLNFFPGSPRFLSLEAAEKVRSEMASTVAAVGVFVNAPVEEVREAARALELDFVQLHGEEPPEYLEELEGLRVIRAFRCRDDSLAPVEGYLAQCRVPPRVVLLDAYSPGAYGGTGKVLEWTQLAECQGQVGSLPLILAGGLTPANVAEAIQKVKPAAVDTASGVEQSPGQKDANAIRGFVAEAWRAFETSA